MADRYEEIAAVARAIARVQLNGGDPEQPAMRWNGTQMEPQDFPVWHDYRDEAVAAVAALRDQDAWWPIGDPEHPAPRDGTQFLAVVDGLVRIVSWGKTSHVPLYGFCLADQGPEEYDLCQPTHHRPLPAPPLSGRKPGPFISGEPRG